MALQVEVGQITIANNSTSQVFSLSDATITGKCIILWCDGMITPANGTNITAANFTFGVSDGTNHRCFSWSTSDTASLSGAAVGFETTMGLEVFSNTNPTILAKVTGVSFAAGTFTLTFAVNPADAELISYMILGGADITNAKVGSFALNTSTGNQSTTDPGFQPDFVLLFHTGRTTSGTATASFQAGIGFAVSATKREAAALAARSGQTSALNARSIQRSNAVLTGITIDGTTEDLLADFVTMDSTGFTINITNAPTAAWLCGYLAIKGGQWDVGNSVKPTTATAQTVTGEAFQPKGLFLLNTHQTTLAAVAAPCDITVGAATGTSNRTYVGASEDDVFNTVSKHAMQSTKCIAELAKTTVEANFTSFNSDGWTITWAATGVADNIGWFAMASSPFAPEDDMVASLTPCSQPLGITTVFS